MVQDEDPRKALTLIRDVGCVTTQNESYMTDWDLLDYCGLQLPKHAESLRTVQNGQRRHSQ